MRWLKSLAVATLVVACAPTFDYIGPAEGPPHDPPWSESDEFVVEVNWFTDPRDELKSFCYFTFQWAEASDGIGWVAVAEEEDLVEPVFDREYFCTLGGTESPITYEVPLDELPAGWYTVCNFELCTEPFEKT